MLRGAYSAISGMIAQDRRQEALTNNLSNIHTPGYKRDDAVMRSFPEYLLQRIRDQEQITVNGKTMPGQPVKIGALSHGVYTQELIPYFSQGDLVETGNPFDVAIYDAELLPQEADGRLVKPSLFFTVQTRDGDVRYTRNGNWTLDNENKLVTAEGHLVLNENGEPIQIENQNFTVDADGVIRVPTDDPNVQEEVARLALIGVNNPLLMVKEGNNVYRWEGAEEPFNAFIAQDAKFELRQGYQERSNVDPTQTIADMMQVLRLYEANQKTFQAYDRTLQNLNEIGRL